MMMADAIRKISPFDFWDFCRDYIDKNPLFKQKRVKPGDKLLAKPSSFDFAPYYTKFPILLEPEGEHGTILNVFQIYIRKLISEQRIGYALCYRHSYIALNKFGGNPYFSDITVSWLRRYEAWEFGKGNSRGRVGIVLRSLRCIFNEVAHMGIISKEKCYPFGRRKYMIPTSKKVKKALTLEEIGLLYFDEPTCEDEARAKSYWFFMYFENRLNPKDLAHLRYKNIDGEYLSFYREKTDLTAIYDPKLITVYINEDMGNTIERYGNADKSPDNYIFPVLKPGMDPLEKYFAVPRFTHFINDWMAKIGSRNKIEIKPTTIVTRHSFSTIIKRAGASTEFIQEALGHMDKRTTENYLGSFENETKKEFAKNLEKFKVLPEEMGD